jgi:glycosyltransferase involved in cell wall biosynthesis
MPRVRERHELGASGVGVVNSEQDACHRPINGATRRFLARKLGAPPTVSSQMTKDADAIRVLQSFPHKIGAARICNTAWHQAAGVAAAGGDVLVLPGAVHRPLPAGVRSRPTLARGRWRIPYRAIGHLRAFKLHDRLVARALPKLAGEIDLVHTWPLGALETLRTAQRLGIPTVLERPNAHTRFAYRVVEEECRRLGVALPRDHEHAFNATILRREEAEYELADHLLCPSDFVARTFVDEGVPSEKLARHHYGYDDQLFHPSPEPRAEEDGLTLLFVGVAAVRKGLHFALQAWLESPASRTGRFLIAGEFLPAYERRLAPMLAHPSVHVLGHRTDVPELLRAADAFVLPSIEEGFPLACVEAVASGAVPLVSDACSEACIHGESGLVHPVGDVATLSEHITAIHQDRALVERLRSGCLASAPAFTWGMAGVRLVQVYREAVTAGEAKPRVQPEIAA